MQRMMPQSLASEQRLVVFLIAKQGGGGLRSADVLQNDREKMNGRSRCRHADVCLLPVLVLFSLAVPPGNASAEQWWRGGVGFSRQPHFTADGATDCLSCHFGEKMQAIAASPHGNSANPASPYSKAGCESCHGPGSFHVSRAHGGKGFPELLRFGRGSGFSSRQQQLTACLACHENPDSGAPLIGFTGSVHDLSPVNCSRCHEAHTHPQPLDTAAHQAGICFACHRKQKEQHPLLGQEPVDFGTLPCSKCHDVHPAGKER
jgi:predicted CXXCH cytochrome family protein